MIVIACGDVKVEVIQKALAHLPDILIREVLPTPEPFIYTKLPEIEQPRIVSIKEAEEPFYKRFDKRRGKRKNRR